MAPLTAALSPQPIAWRGPFAGSYLAAVVMVLCALTPFLVLSSASPPLEGLIGKDVGLGHSGMEMTAGIADAAYCFGTILAVQLIARLPARRLLVVYDTADTLGFLVEAVEPPPKCRRPLSPRKPPSL